MLQMKAMPVSVAIVQHVQLTNGCHSSTACNVNDAVHVVSDGNEVPNVVDEAHRWGR